MNPWWSSRLGFDADASLEAFADSPLQLDRSADVRLRFDADAIYILRGPRQAGKTTLLKQALQNAAASGLPATDLLYLSCDRQSADGLQETLAGWLDLTATGSRRRVVVLDEASDVPEWTTVLRALWNRGLLRKVTVVASGSHALDLRRATETLPGRRGEGRRAKGAPPLDQVLLPASFRAYALARLSGHSKARDLAAVPTFSASELATSPKVARAAGQLLPFARDLHEAFDDYLLCGGFPIPAADLHRKGAVAPEVYRLHAGAVGTDLVRFGLSDRSAAQVARRIVEALSNPVSWSTLVAGTDIASHVTGKSYAEAFAAAFLAYEVPPIDLSKKEPVWRRERKLYPADPFILHSLRAWGRSDADPFGASQDFARDPASFGLLLEVAVASALARDSPPALFAGLDTARRLAYLRTRGGREVDFVVRGTSGLTPIEVKSRAEAKVDRNGMRLVGPGIIVTRSDTRLAERPRLLSAPTFLFLLGPG